MSKVFKILAFIILSFIIITTALLFTFIIITKDAKLDKNKLVGAGNSVIICDADGNEITSASIDAKNKSVAVADLPPHTLNAFIASEDRTFYKHNGLNYKRMAKALYKNIISRSFKEGASTISQQLIKNTHLSNDKTIKRKLKEIKLTRSLEKSYKKNEILEMYLNTIYFGHNCYGLQSAAEFYFNKKAENLSLNESATVVGLLASPNNYSPFKNPEKCLRRRNTVLKAMYDCKYIDEATYRNAVNEPLNAESTDRKTKYGDYVNAVFDELEEIDFDFYKLTDGCTVGTYMDMRIQSFIENADYPCDNSVIVTDNATGGINAYKSTVNGAKRQPGSTVKPIFVYAPALEEKQINAFTEILDERTDFNGYSPENYDKRYHGYVSVTHSIMHSLNIPAVKILNNLTVRTAEKYISAMRIKLEDEERNLALALGGMKYGVSLKELADCYSVFPNGGSFRPAKFIKEIKSRDGKIIYSAMQIPERVFSAGTCSLMNDILIQTSKEGTAKALKDIKFDVAAKTGTCGNEDGNTDAYAMGYTSDKCIGVWLGDRNNERSSVTGGNQCCKLLKELLLSVYADYVPQPLDTTSGTTTVELDGEEYFNNKKTVLADPVCPKINKLSVKVLQNNIPLQQSDRFTSPTISTPVISVDNGTVNIKLCHAKYYSFIVKRSKNSENELIYDGKWIKTVTDTPPKGSYIYTVTPYFDDGQIKHFGKEIVLPSVNIGESSASPQIKIPDIANGDWYNQ